MFVYFSKCDCHYHQRTANKQADIIIRLSAFVHEMFNMVSKPCRASQLNKLSEQMITGHCSLNKIIK